jgi:hypothetical protein
MSRLVDSTASGITSWRIVWFALVLLLNYMSYQFIKCEIGITYYFLLVVFQSHIVKLVPQVTGYGPKFYI